MERLQRFPFRGYAYGALALYGVAHVGIMASLHPDEYVYYNGFIGGVEGAAGLFKLDYWANSYAEAVGGLEDHLRAEYGADFMDHDFTVAVCGPPVSAAYYFPSNFIFTANRENAEFFIAFTKDDCEKSVAGNVIYRVERMGTLLSEVIDRRPVRAAATSAARRGASLEGTGGWSAANMSGSPPEDRMWWFRSLHANLLSALAEAGGARHRRILDAGCGTGGLLARLSSRLPGGDGRGPRVRRRGDTPCPRQERRGPLPRLGRSLALRGERLRRHPQRRRPLPSWASTRTAALGEFRRCLAPGGLLMLNLPAYPWLYSVA